MASGLFDLNEIPEVDDEEYGAQHNSRNATQVNRGQTQLEGDTEFNQANEDTEGDLPHQPQAEDSNQATAHHRPPMSRLSSETKTHVLHVLLTKLVDGQLPYGVLKQTAKEMGISTRSIGRIWGQAKRQHEANQDYNVKTKYSNCGRKRTTISQDDVKAIHMGDRTCIRDLASKLNISKSTCQRLIKIGLMRPHTNPLHPGLTDLHKEIRLRWVLSLLQGETLQEKKHYYPMYDFVHIDEKWFYQTKKTNRCYLAQHEEGQYRAASNSKWIPKVMFATAVARPRFNSDGECTFDGKIGIFPFTIEQPAKRKSKYRARGTIITKCIERVNQKVTRHMLIEQIIPAIKAKWPDDGNHHVIYIQQDNAKAHILQEDKEWQQVFQQERFTFILLQQPANSPDLNILDLGFFRSIQSLMHKKMPKDVDKMLSAVHDAFYELDPITLGNVWMSLQFVMNEILKSKGGNGYLLPHANKKKFRIEGNRPTEIDAPEEAVKEAWHIIHGIDVTHEEQEQAQLEAQLQAEQEDQAYEQAQEEAIAYDYT